MPKILDSFETYYKFKKISEENPVIFIHGIGLNHEIWDQQVNYFKKSLSEHPFYIKGNIRKIVFLSDLIFIIFSEDPILKLFFRGDI